MAILPLDPAESPETLQTKKEANRHALNESWMSALLHKRGKALAISLHTALNDANAHPSDGSQQRLIPELVGVFGALSPEQQATWLQYRWDAIKDPKWLRLLRSIAPQYKDYSNDRETGAYQSLQLTGTALMRWYELDPAGARNAVIKEIVGPKPGYDARLLGILPDKTLPEAEQQLAQHFLATSGYEVEGKIASLIFRYADSDVWPEVASKVTEHVGTWACELQDTMLAYALRVDPQVADRLIERAVAARGEKDNACRHGLFSEIGKLWTDPVLEDLAIKGLADSDPQVAQHAAAYLGNYGSANAEKRLWERYEAWSRQWIEREREMPYVLGDGNPNAEQAGVGDSLARALATGVGWLSHQSQLRRIQQLGVGQNISQMTENALAPSSQRPLVIVCMAIGIPEEPYHFALAQYELHWTDALKTKLREFPRGTKFLWDPSNCGSSAEVENIFSEIAQFASENGIVLQRAPAVNNPAGPGEGSPD